MQKLSLATVVLSFAPRRTRDDSREKKIVTSYVCRDIRPFWHISTYIWRCNFLLSRVVASAGDSFCTTTVFATTSLEGNETTGAMPDGDAVIDKVVATVKAGSGTLLTDRSLANLLATDMWRQRNVECRNLVPEVC